MSVFLSKFETKLGTNKGTPRSRVWIEGQRLIESGFTVGTRYHRVTHAGQIILTVNPEGKFKVSGKGEKPIIDITGATVTSLLTGTHAEVSFHPHSIVISNPVQSMELAA